MLSALFVVIGMPTVDLGDEVHLPFVSLGTGSGQKGNVTAAVQLWLDAGGAAVDTAYDYQDEPQVAKGIAAARSSVKPFLLTKIPCSTYAKAKSHIESNLKDLQVTCSLSAETSPSPPPAYTSRTHLQVFLQVF